MTEYTLIKYRDAHMYLSEYTWFWVDDKQQMVSPMFKSEQDAMQWNMQDEWDNWKAIKEFV